MRILGAVAALCVVLASCGGSGDGSESVADDVETSSPTSEPGAATSAASPSGGAATTEGADPAPLDDPAATVQDVADAIGCTFPDDLDPDPTADTLYPCQNSENQLQISFWTQSRRETEKLFGALDSDTYFFVNDHLVVAGFDATEVAQAKADLGP